MSKLDQYVLATLLARGAVERLKRQGHSVDEARKMVAAVIHVEEYGISKGAHSFDVTRFGDRLRELPG
jgi:hypothetical protein